MIEDKNYVIFLLRNVLNTFIEFGEDNLPADNLLVTLGGDGASVKPVFQSSSNAVYTYEVLPLTKDIPPVVVYMTKAKNGSSSASIVKTFNLLSKYLIKAKYIVKFRATDGDVSFDVFHKKFFDKKVDPLLENSFDKILQTLIDEIEIPISDILHLLKTTRARIINHLLLMWLAVPYKMD